MAQGVKEELVGFGLGRGRAERGCWGREEGEVWMVVVFVRGPGILGEEWGG